MRTVSFCSSRPETPHASGFDQRFRRYELENVLISAEFHHVITFVKKVVKAWELMRWIQRERHLEFERVKNAMIFSKFSKCGRLKCFDETSSTPPFSTVLSPLVHFLSVCYF